MNLSIILKVIGIVCLGALGALIFNIFLLPYMLGSPYFENFQFIKDFKEGKIVVNQKESVYIQENTALETAIVKVKNSVVAIEGATLASGFIASSDGNIITLASLIPASKKVSVFLHGQSVPFAVTKIDTKNNLALLKIDVNNLQTVGFADPVKTKLGQKVFLIAPVLANGDNWFANEGIIRGLHKELMLGTVPVIQTTILEKPVVNGSPLFNIFGELVGINVIGQEGVVFTIPIESIRAFLGNENL